ncbi:MAG TPA: MFS transporter [Anaerolineales bacterium]|nr:MFS transporter [Anaerolineales bacterium]HRQ91888.1 MFS transporter [Anaerolineales bacterium]
MRAFLTIWAGQVVSLVSSGMTGFALGLWVYEQTSQATPFVLIALFNAIPPFIVSPFAGVLVDRLNRKTLMLLADTATAVSTLLLFILFSQGQLQLWQLYLATLVTSAAGIFQMLAYQTIVTSLVPREQLSRANAMVQTAQSLAAILSPIAAAAAYGTLGLSFIFGLDLAGFTVAALMLLVVRIPQPAAQAVKLSLLADLRMGFDYLRTRPGLISLAVLISLLNLMLSASTVLSTPMILGFTTAQVLSVMQSVSSVGLLLGGVWASAGHQPRRKVLTIVLCAIVSGLGLAASGLQPSPVLIAVGFFLFMFPITMINASIRAVVQVKVPENLQGRVFSLIVMISRAGVLLSMLLAAPLADRLFEPAMAVGGSLGRGLLGMLLGAGPGRGIGLMLLVSGLGMVTAALGMYAYPRMRHVERELPDATVG